MSNSWGAAAACWLLPAVVAELFRRIQRGGQRDFRPGLPAAGRFACSCIDGPRVAWWLTAWTRRLSRHGIAGCYCVHVHCFQPCLLQQRGSLDIGGAGGLPALVHAHCLQPTSVCQHHVARVNLPYRRAIGQQFAGSRQVRVLHAASDDRESLARIRVRDYSSEYPQPLGLLVVLQRLRHLRSCAGCVRKATRHGAAEDLSGGNEDYSTQERRNDHRCNSSTIEIHLLK